MFQEYHTLFSTARQSGRDRSAAGKNSAHGHKAEKNASLKGLKENGMEYSQNNIIRL